MNTELAATHGPRSHPTVQLNKPTAVLLSPRQCQGHCSDPLLGGHMYLYIHINKNFLCQQGWLTDDWRQPTTLWSLWQECKACLLKEGNTETEMSPRQKNCSSEWLPWTKVQWFLQHVLMSSGQKWDAPIIHCKGKKPASRPLVKNLRGLSVVRALVCHVFTWMRRGYWLPIHSLRITGRPCCTDTTICYRQNKSSAVGSLSLIAFGHLPFWTYRFPKEGCCAITQSSQLFHKQIYRYLNVIYLLRGLQKGFNLSVLQEACKGHYFKERDPCDCSI